MSDNSFEQKTGGLYLWEKYLEVSIFENKDGEFHIIPVLPNKLLNPNISGAFGEKKSPICSIEDWQIRKQAQKNPETVDSSEKQQIIDDVNKKISLWFTTNEVSFKASDYNEDFEKEVYSRMQKYMKENKMQ